MTEATAHAKDATAAFEPAGRRRHRLPHQGALLRHLQGGPRHGHSDQEELDHGLHRTVGLRQEHRAALPESHERPRARLPLRGPRALPRQGHLPSVDRSGRRAALHRHGVPAAESVRHQHLQQRRLRPAAERLQGQQAGRVEKALRAPRCGTKSRTSCRRAGCRSPAASSSGSASRARSPPSPKCC